MKPLKAAFLLIPLLLPSLLIAEPADEKPRVPWTMDENYEGIHTDSFNKLRAEVPILMRQTLIDLAVRCGLDFQEGWAMPLVVRFVDGSPRGAENILAFVQTHDAGEKGWIQTLNVNLAAYDRDNFNFSKVFAHELVHAMLNDSLGDRSGELPVWFHEGLAVYGANQGEQMVETYVSRYGLRPDKLINGLEGPHGALDYAEDYLAFKYIHDRHGVNSLHNLVQEIIKRRGDVRGSIEATCFERWPDFQENARKFAEDEVARLDRQHMTRTEAEKKPY
jgi:hypothetical protein